MHKWNMTTMHGYVTRKMCYRLGLSLSFGCWHLISIFVNEHPETKINPLSYMLVQWEGTYGYDGNKHSMNSFLYSRHSINTILVKK